MQVFLQVCYTFIGLRVGFAVALCIVVQSVKTLVFTFSGVISGTNSE